MGIEDIVLKEILYAFVLVADANLPAILRIIKGIGINHGIIGAHHVTDGEGYPFIITPQPK